MIERKEYLQGRLDAAQLDPDPCKQFREWFEAYVGLGTNPMRNAMTLATASKTGHPTARIVLLKEVNAEGFVFYTNYRSEKAKQLDQNPLASLVFYWPEWERQVMVSGSVTKTSAEESDAYFKTRPREAQIAAVCSEQSEPIESREALETKFASISKENADNVPRPKHWGGYVLKPEVIEFWQGRENRLNDRLRYERQSNQSWNVVRLQP